MSVKTNELTDYARFLRNAAPREFENFFKAFEKYTENTVLTVVNTTGEALPRVQGHAQQCLKLLGVLEEVKNG